MATTERKMRVGFILPANIISGGLFVVYERVRLLLERGHEVILIFSDTYASQTISTYPGVEKARVLNLAQARKEDLEFDWLIATWWETTFDLLALRARRFGYYVQGFEPEFYRDYLPCWMPTVQSTYLIPRLHYFVVSPALEHYLRDFGRQQLYYIKNGVQFEKFHDAVQTLPPKLKRLRVLIEGPGFQQMKRVAEALRIAGTFKDLEIVHVSNDGAMFPELRADYRFSKLTHDEMPGIYRSCDFILKLSTTESFALPVLEMFAAGGTAVVTQFPGMGGYIEDRKNALVVAVDDAKATAHAIESLLTNPSLLEGLRHNAVALSQNWDWRSSSALFADKISSLILAESSSLPAVLGGAALPELKSLEVSYLELRRVLGSQGSALRRKIRQLGKQALNRLRRRAVKVSNG